MELGYGNNVKNWAIRRGEYLKTQPLLVDGTPSETERVSVIVDGRSDRRWLKIQSDPR